MFVIRLFFILGVVLWTNPLLVAQETLSHEQNWPQWRGALGTGEGPQAKPPLHWNETENVRWKCELPGLGHSTPIVWKNQIFLTAAMPYGDRLPPRYSRRPGAHDNVPVSQRHKFVVLAIDRCSGQIEWLRTVHEDLPHEGGHYTGSLASASPVTDGNSLYVFFGSHGIFCLEMSGTVLWKKQFGKMHTKHGHGEGCSPTLHGDKLIINWDHEGQSFVSALDKNTGEQLWRVSRREVTSWSSPIVVAHEQQAQLIVCGTDRVRGYDLTSGETIWECGGLSANVVATPVYADGLVHVASSYDTRAMLTIRLNGARGDITGTSQVVWSRFRGTPYVPSPLLYRGSLYFLRHYQGILTRVDAATGEETMGPVRLGPIRNVYASPVAAAGRIYVTDLDGTTIVISHAEFPRILAVNKLDEGVSASAAIVNNQMFLRGGKHLYCLSEAD